MTTNIVNYADIRDSVELLVTEFKPAITDWQIDEFLDALDDALGNNADQLVLEGDLTEVVGLDNCPKCGENHWCIEVGAYGPDVTTEEFNKNPSELVCKECGYRSLL